MSRKSRKNNKRRGRKNRTHRIRTKGGSNKIYNFYNRFHYGDALFFLKFIYNISDILKERGITINYYYNADYITRPEELQRYTNPDTTKIHAIKGVSYGDVNAWKNATPPGSIEAWGGYDIDGMSNRIMDEYFPKYYMNIINTIGLQDANIDTSLYQNEPYLQDIYNKLDDKYKNLDILIINAAPKSGQLVYHIKKFDEMCTRLSTKYKVAITSPIEGSSIPCTMNDNLALQDIGAISTHAKYIIGIHTGPVVPCFNADTKNHVKKWILFADNDVEHKYIPATIHKNNYDLNNIENEITM